jgi:uroporphyrinogen decarboxylase
VKKSINCAADLAKIDVKSGDFGTFGEQLECVKYIMAGLMEDVPVIQTVFTPIGILMNLCGERSIGRYRESPRENSYLFTLLEEDREGVHQALANITETLIDYVSKLMALGIDGLFYAGLGMAREGFFTLEEWEELVKPYDIQILETIKDKTVIFHTCGIYGNPERFADYPISALHWAQSATGNPKIPGSDAWLNGITPMGGVDERLFGEDKASEIGRRAKKAIEDNKNTPFILAPDCSVSIRTLHEELVAFRGSVNDEERSTDDY